MCGYCEQNSRENSKRYVLAARDEIIFTDLTKQEFFYEYEGLVRSGYDPMEIAAYQQLTIRKVERYDFAEE